jgi:nucleotide-binding universal stress UspA family protein
MVCRWQNHGSTTSASFYDLPSSKMNLISGAFEEYAKLAKAHASEVLSRVADEAKSAGVACETMQMTHDHPYEAIVATAEEKGCDLIVMAQSAPRSSHELVARADRRLAEENVS